MLMMTDLVEPVRRPNRRGLATRAAMLDAALAALSSGDPRAVSANRIAKDIGATWGGAVQYQFGDVDGFWSAVLHRTAERRAKAMTFAAEDDSTLEDRVGGAIIDTLYHGLTSPDSRAIENLRAALPQDPRELERLYPRTAAELSSWAASWLSICQARSPVLMSIPSACAMSRHSSRARCAAWSRNANWVRTPTWTSPETR